MHGWHWFKRFDRLWARSLGIALLVLGLSMPAFAVIETSEGNSPIADDHWPAGSVDVANIKTRFGRWDGPPYWAGESHFLYRGDVVAFQEALDTFAKIKAFKLLLIVYDGGPMETDFFKDDRNPKANARYDWSFTVWNLQSWNQLYNDPFSQFSAEGHDGRFRETVAPPKLDVYVGGNGIDFSKVKVPAGVSVNDERADANGFPGGSVVIGDLLDMKTSKPVAGAKIAISREKAYDQWDEVATCISNADGHFELRSTLIGHFGAIASADGYASRVLGDADLRGDTYCHFVDYLSPATTLSGMAVDTDDKPVAAATVRLDPVMGFDGRGYWLPALAESKSDASGKFVLTGLPQGYGVLYFYGTHLAGIDVIKLHPIPEDDLVVRLTGTGVIKGRVLDKAGHPAAHGNVDIEPPGKARDHIGKWGGGSDTAADGSFHFEDVPPGQYIISAMATNPGPALEGNDPNAKTITLKAGQTLNVDITGR